MHLITSALAVLSALAVSLAALAAPPASRSLRDALLGERQVVQAERYRTDDGRRAFVLDRTGAEALLRFDGDYEVLALSQVPAARGDVLFRADTGEDVLRITSLGGVTVYPRETPTGIPASNVGTGEAIAAVTGGEGDFAAALEELRVHSAQYNGAAIAIDAPTIAGAEAALFADAVRLTLMALGQLDRTGDSESIQSLERIRFIRASAAGAIRTGGVLSVDVAPGLGYAGRPSSHRIVDVIRTD